MFLPERKTDVFATLASTISELLNLYNYFTVNVITMDLYTV